MPGKGLGRAMIHAGRGSGMDSPDGNLIFRDTGNGWEGSSQAGRRAGKGTQPKCKSGNPCLSLNPTLNCIPPCPAHDPRFGCGVSDSESLSVTETGGRA